MADKETESFGVLYLSKSYKLVSSKVYFLVVFYLKSTYGGFCVLFIIIKIHQLFIFIDMYMFFITSLINIRTFFGFSLGDSNILIEKKIGIYVSFKMSSNHIISYAIIGIFFRHTLHIVYIQHKNSKRQILT